MDKGAQRTAVTPGRRALSRPSTRSGRARTSAGAPLPYRNGTRLGKKIAAISKEDLRSTTDPALEQTAGSRSKSRAESESENNHCEFKFMPSEMGGRSLVIHDDINTRTTPLLIRKINAFLACSLMPLTDSLDVGTGTFSSAQIFPILIYTYTGEIPYTDSPITRSRKRLGPIDLTFGVVTFRDRS
ncbi:hypothetical protein EVAR_19250_1 [Eumeta japonica]|uniref:Uncharacterized protein n=1 Tax=Eumeta variegata TaxID=151549 RepID=A0A4C1UEJ7_EUMVA|nr:hypothetical protein EVAR_19250_1 [Eumeta japonica]